MQTEQGLTQLEPPRGMWQAFINFHVTNQLIKLLLIFSPRKFIYFNIERERERERERSTHGLTKTHIEIYIYIYIYFIDKIEFYLMDSTLY